MSVSMLVLFILVLVLLGVLPTWGHSRSWGYRPTYGVSVLIIIFLLFLLSGRL